MIEFHFETDFVIKDKTKYTDWLNRVIDSEGLKLGQLDYIFCSDDYLLNINKQFLEHDTYTDIITFDYAEHSIISGDVFISVDRVKENAKEYKEDFDIELLRVMAHGILHLIGYNDKTLKEEAEMRRKENEKIKMFHVEQ